MESTEDIDRCVWTCQRSNPYSSWGEVWRTGCGQVNPTLHQIKGSICKYCHKEVFIDFPPKVFAQSK